MRQARVIVALLVPAFWLALTVGSFFEPAEVAGVANFCDAHTAADTQPQEFSNHASDFEAIALSSARRQRPESASPVPVVQVLFKSALQVCTAEPCAYQAVEVQSLMRTWQFRLRAALNPRAPSCLS